MLVNKNEVIPFQKSPWVGLCENGVLIKYPFFQNQNLRGCFNQAPQQHHFCTVNSLSVLQKSFGYATNKFRRFYRVPEKLSFSRKLKITKFEQLFYQK